MRIFKLLSFLTLTVLLCISCEKDAPEQIVFYSKDQLKKDLAIQINNTEGNIIPINSNTIINLTSSKVFKDNLIYLRAIDVEKLSFKIKNFKIDPTSVISNIEVFVDEIKITGNDVSFDFWTFVNNGLEFKINNKEILSAISSKLLQKKQIVISYYSDAVSDKLFSFDLEFSLTTKGTFID